MLLAVTALVVGLLLAGLVFIDKAPLEGAGSETLSAKVIEVQNNDCKLTDSDCLIIKARITDKIRTGQVITLSLDPVKDQGLDVGDKIKLQSGGTTTGLSYAYPDRTTPLLVLAALFCLMTIGIGRARGARALLSLIVSLLVIFKFILPAVASGASPVLVALVGGGLVVAGSILFGYGIKVKSICALVSTVLTVVVGVGLAFVFAAWANLSGFEPLTSYALAASIDPEVVSGIVVAGMVITILGLLDDITVTQASVVLALKKNNPKLGFIELGREASEVGRDHLASTVNTLAMAYLGTNLPLLVFLAISSTSVSDFINNEILATALVGIGVGTVVSLLALPISTWITAAFAGHIELEEIHEHVHAH